MGLTHPSSQQTSAETIGELVLKNQKGLTKRVQEEVPSRRKKRPAEKPGGGRRGQCRAGGNCAQASLSLTVCQSADLHMASGPTWIPAETRRNPARGHAYPISVSRSGRHSVKRLHHECGRGGLTGRVSWGDLELFVQCVTRVPA